MKSLPIALGICLVATRCLFATPQGGDTIFIGGHTYGIRQQPMSGYWHSADEPPKGRVLIPDFEATSSANWKGYTAEWSISRGKLQLINLEGQIAGRTVKNRDIMKKRLPIHAHWFTGKIFVSVGNFDEDKQAFEYVIEFDIKDGDVKATTFREWYSIPITWNGLADIQKQTAP